MRSSPYTALFSRPLAISYIYTGCYCTCFFEGVCECTWNQQVETDRETAPLYACVTKAVISVITSKPNLNNEFPRDPEKERTWQNNDPRESSAERQQWVSHLEVRNEWERREKGLFTFKQYKAIFVVATSQCIPSGGMQQQHKCATGKIEEQSE